MIGSGTTAGAVDLYTGEVPVADQSVQARDVALRDALAQVLVKVTGDPEAPRAPSIAPFLAAAGRYAQQFQYRTRQLPPVDPDLDVAPERELMLSARFDPSAVERMLSEAGLPRWGQERPTVLVWLVKEEGRERRLVGLDDPVLADAVQRAASRRGLPVLFPLLDLADQRAVTERELWGGFTEPLARASARYGTETFLLSRIESAGERWQARWTLYDRGRESHFESAGDTPAEALAEGVGHSATLLGQRFAVAATEQAASRVRVAVDGVGDVADYDRVLDYLSGLSLVRRVQPEAAEGDRLSLNVWLDAGLDRLDQAIQLGEVLAPADDAVSAATATGLAHHRHYRLGR